MHLARRLIVGFFGPLVGLVSVAATWAAPSAALKSPLEPAEALKQIVLPAGYRAELVASEPQIV
ncbi:MAG TPA: hypothetical protein VG433_11325, partial [Pirellulales bacterium]|nr:hypothetical protein [Pirellulales bacterium]